MCPVDKVRAEGNACDPSSYYFPDDADANLDDSAGQLIFLARTCVQVRQGHSFITLLFWGWRGEG